tara:strand:- start:115 stop:543 length:429 start_codon:yes stop_codon:yes gene_type:complete
MARKFMIDIDGTICSLALYEKEDGGFDNNEKKARPYKDRIAYFNNLYDEGNEIHYWTARGNSAKTFEEAREKYFLTMEQLEAWGVKYTTFEIKKPDYDVWIDDKAHNVNDYFKGLGIPKDEEMTQEDVFYMDAYDEIHNTHR